jgi:tRNA (guanine37-N1)-methyltransferase
MNIGIISLFPEIFSALNYGVVGRAIIERQIELTIWNPRDYTTDKHQRVDDRPYGGGAGMVMQVQPLQAAIQAAKQQLPQAAVVYLTPQGKVLNQALVQSLSTRPALILLNGRYEGIDERLIATEVDEEYSIGDYVLSGGEFASLVMIDAMARCLPGVLGHPDSAVQDSFTANRLDYPHYTRPESIAGLEVPPVLLGGDHRAIARWRLKQSLGRTWQRRPDLLATQCLSAEEQALLTEFIDELRNDSCIKSSAN